MPLDGEQYTTLFPRASEFIESQVRYGATSESELVESDKQQLAAIYLKSGVDPAEFLCDVISDDVVLFTLARFLQRPHAQTDDLCEVFTREILIAYREVTTELFDYWNGQRDLEAKRCLTDREELRQQSEKWFW